jgi:Xaa-Pro aminopeptidase
MREIPIRVRQIQDALLRARLDATVLRLPENVLLSTGWFVQMPGLALAVVPAQGPAVLMVPEYEALEAEGIWKGEIRTFPAIRHDREPVDAAISRILKDLASEVGARAGAIGYEGSFESVAPGSLFGEPNAVAAPTQELIRSTFATDTLVDFSPAIEAIRAVKTEHEVEMLRRTNEIAVFGLNAFKQAARPGATEVEVMAAVEHAIMVDGHGYRDARCVRGFATVCSGPELADGWQYWRGRRRTIEAGDVVMLELGTVADGYWSDHTRTVVAGRASSGISEAYAAVRAALEAALAAARPGATGGAVDAAAREACSRRGLAQFPHHTGHGTGFRYHESSPALVPGSTDAILEGHVVAAEPGIYGPELNGGVRHEDDALVTANGAVVLATTDYPLDLE